MKTITIEIPEYIRKIKLSERRMIKYYKAGKKAPTAKKYLDKTKYDYRKFATASYLVDLETGERVIANPLAQGTPNIMAINGQKIYNGEMNPNTRNKVLQAIKKQISEYTDKLDPITDFPINIMMEVHDVIRDPGCDVWDIDNRAYPYQKAFPDCLTGNKDKTGTPKCKVIIPDDNIFYLTAPPAPKFIPVNTPEERKLVFIITKETDPRLMKNKDYQKEAKKQYEKDEKS